MNELAHSVESLIPKFSKTKALADVMPLLSMEEAHILKRVDGQSSVAELANSLDQEPEQVLEHLKELSSRGLILLAYMHDGQMRYHHATSTAPNQSSEEGGSPVAFSRFKLAKKAVMRSEINTPSQGVPMIRSDAAKKPRSRKPTGTARLPNYEAMQQQKMANELADSFDSIEEVSTSSIEEETAFAFAEESFPTQEIDQQSIELSTVLVESKDVEEASHQTVEPVDSVLQQGERKLSPPPARKSRFQKVQSYHELAQVSSATQDEFTTPTQDEPALSTQEELDVATTQRVNVPFVMDDNMSFADEDNDDDLDMFLDEVLSDPGEGHSQLEVGALESIDPEHFSPDVESVEEISIDDLLVDSAADNPAPKPTYDLEMLTEIIESEPAPKERAQAVLTDDAYFDDLMNNPPPEVLEMMEESHASERAQAVLTDDAYFDDLMNNPPPEVLEMMEPEAPSNEDVFTEDISLEEIYVEDIHAADSMLEVDVADVYFEEVSAGENNPSQPGITDSLLDGLDEIGTQQPTESAEAVDAVLASTGSSNDMSREGRMARILQQIPMDATTLPPGIVGAVQHEFSNHLKALLQFFESEQPPHLHAHARLVMTSLFPDLSVYTEHLKKASPALTINLLVSISLLSDPDGLELLIKYISDPEPVIQTAMLDLADSFMAQATPIQSNTIRSRIRDLINSEDRDTRERGYQWLEQCKQQQWVSLALKLLSEEAHLDLDELERIALLSSRLNPRKTLPVLEKLAEPPGRFSMERTPRKNLRFAAITAFTDMANPKTEAIIRKLMDRSQGELKDRCITAMQEIRKQR